VNILTGFFNPGQPSWHGLAVTEKLVAKFLPQKALLLVDNLAVRKTENDEIDGNQNDCFGKDYEAKPNKKVGQIDRIPNTSVWPYGSECWGFDSS
jgi:hypothetical protein